MKLYRFVRKDANNLHDSRTGFVCGEGYVGPVPEDVLRRLPKWFEPVGTSKAPASEPKEGQTAESVSEASKETPKPRGKGDK